MLNAQFWRKNDITNFTGREIGTLTIIAGYKKLLIHPLMLSITPPRALILFFVTTTFSQNMEIIFPFLKKTTTRSYMVRLIFAYPFPPIYPRDVCD